MDTQQPPKRPLGLIIALFATAVSLTIMPRLLPEIELSRSTVLWVPVVHQIILAILLASIVWILTGKRRSMATLVVVLIVIVWGPNLAAAIDYSLTGNNETVFAMSERLGLTSTLNTMYAFFYDSLGYALAVQRAN